MWLAMFLTPSTIAAYNGCYISKCAVGSLGKDDHKNISDQHISCDLCHAGLLTSVAVSPELSCSATFCSSSAILFSSFSFTAPACCSKAVYLKTITYSDCFCVCECVSREGLIGMVSKRMNNNSVCPHNVLQKSSDLPDIIPWQWGSFHAFRGISWRVIHSYFFLKGLQLLCLPVVLEQNLLFRIPWLLQMSKLLRAKRSKSKVIKHHVFTLITLYNQL